MKTAVFILGSINLVDMEKNKKGCNFMCARLSGNILFYFFADNFTGSKDTEPYKTDVSFLCQYIFGIHLKKVNILYLFSMSNNSASTNPSNIVHQIIYLSC